MWSEDKVCVWNVSSLLGGPTLSLSLCIMFCNHASVSASLLKAKACSILSRTCDSSMTCKSKFRGGSTMKLLFLGLHETIESMELSSTISYALVRNEGTALPSSWWEMEAPHFHRCSEIHPYPKTLEIEKTQINTWTQPAMGPQIYIIWKLIQSSTKIWSRQMENEATKGWGN